MNGPIGILMVFGRLALRLDAFFSTNLGLVLVSLWNDQRRVQHTAENISREQDRKPQKQQVLSNDAVCRTGAVTDSIKVPYYGMVILWEVHLCGKGDFAPAAVFSARNSFLYLPLSSVVPYLYRGRQDTTCQQLDHILAQDPSDCLPGWTRRT